MGREPPKTKHRYRFGLDEKFMTSTHLPTVIKEQVAVLIDKAWLAYLKENFGVEHVSELSDDGLEDLYAQMRTDIERMHSLK